MSENTEFPCFTMELDEVLAGQYALAIWEALPEAEKLSHGELIQKRLAQDVLFLSRMVRNLQNSLVANETQLKEAKETITELYDSRMRSDALDVEHYEWRLRGQLTEIERLTDDLQVKDRAILAYTEALSRNKPSSLKYTIATVIGAGIVLLWQWLR